LASPSLFAFVLEFLTLKQRTIEPPIPASFPNLIARAVHREIARTFAIFFGRTLAATFAT
jgi:hypothetical protein